MVIDQGSQDGDQELPGLQNEGHGYADWVKGRVRHQFRFYHHSYWMTCQSNPAVAPPRFHMPCREVVHVSRLGKVCGSAGLAVPAEIRVRRGHVNVRILES